MAILAIRGHATRGKEVIEILEMFGGDNFLGHDGREECFYYCFRDGKIKSLHYSALNTVSYCAFTLEQFFQKFPYKIGDKVKLGGDIIEITNFGWDMTSNEVLYVGISIVDKSRYGYMSVKQLRPYTEQKEETMEEKKTPKTQEEVNDYLLQHSVKNAMNLLDIEKCLNDDGLGLPNGVMVKSDGIGSIEFIRWYEKPQYPKTYEECCKVLILKPERATFSVSGLEYKRFSVVNLQRLLICRDAYWKVAGDWKPSNCQIVYGISRCSGEIKKIDDLFGGNMVLEFPTEEMRDAFYENFKELIESCKELL